jgi:hypothetical protein
MELDDLAAHQTDVVEPISYVYGKDVRVYEVGTTENLDWTEVASVSS